MTRSSVAQRVLAGGFVGCVDLLCSENEAAASAIIAKTKVATSRVRDFISSRPTSRSLPFLRFGLPTPYVCQGPAVPLALRFSVAFLSAKIALNRALPPTQH